jgi:3-hydroxyisobutyrate dehydrogenase-like beta-hydroxyacid dehydrogenase
VRHASRKGGSHRAHGGVVARNIRDLARTAEVLLSCLTNDEAVPSVYTELEGVLAGARPGTVALEMSIKAPSEFESRGVRC